MTHTPAAATVAEASLAPVVPKAILVVDDEEEVAALVAEVLQRDGHTVQIASNGAAALGMLARGRYDLVLTDTKMPVLDGIGLYREIERRFPSLQGHVIFVTGDILDAEKQQFLADAGTPVITKPFDFGDVRSVVRRLLANTPARSSGT